MGSKFGLVSRPTHGNGLINHPTNVVPSMRTTPPNPKKLGGFQTTSPQLFATLLWSPEALVGNLL
jgi:hypothetical protein